MRNKTTSTQVMGILNVTPDSFSDGGQFNSVDAAIEQAQRMVAEGADWIDVGGESTRPGADAVAEGEELDRVVPVIEAICQRFDIQVSVDSSKGAVMREAVNAGAHMINDVRALREEGALEAAASTTALVCLMHMQGQPREMQRDPDYGDVVMDVKDFLQEQIERCTGAGIDKNRLLLDPGFGFGKTVRHNYQLLQRLHSLHEFDLPLLIGLSRKSMLGAVTQTEVGDRLAASVAGATIAALKGAHIVRVHDVKATVDAMQVVHATLNGEF
jgi:dihydropteroate synthase